VTTGGGVDPASIGAPEPRVGVVDIGSNSVRMVVFCGPPRALMPMFNEKVLCALGRDIETTGRLNPDGRELALTTLARFAALAEKMAVAPLHAVATAAVREAEDGPAFVAEVKRRCGIRVTLLSGVEEARLAARGVVAGIPDADGVVGDLGGGSLELVALRRGRAGPSATLPLGPQRLAVGGRRTRTGLIDAKLATVPWLADATGATLYVVGGSWRTLARIHMAQARYPLRIIHQYALSRREVEEFLRLVSRQSAASLRRIEGVTRKRLEVLPTSALVLQRLIRAVKPQEIVFSAHGVREGIMFDRLSAAERRRDPLLVACRDMEARESRCPGFGDELAAWCRPLFAGAEAAVPDRARLAACLLADVAWRLHPDYRDEQAFRRILRAPFAGIDHRGRAFLALAVYARYRGGIDGRAAADGRRLLGEAASARAERLGLALRLGHALAGGTPGLLADARLALGKETLALRLAPASAALGGEAVERGVSALAASFEKRGEVVVGSGPAGVRRRRPRGRAAPA